MKRLLKTQKLPAIASFVSIGIGATNRTAKT